MLSLRPRGWLSLAALLLFFSPLLAENALAARITADPAQGPAGTAVTVRGTEWSPGELIELSWNFNPFHTVASVQANNNGAFIATITVPQQAPLGRTEINAINQAGNATWQVPFTVTRNDTPAAAGTRSDFANGIRPFLRRCARV